MTDIITRILLIEDDRVDQMAFERLIKEKSLSYDYSIAGSVSEARSVLKTEKFDIVVADYLLGDGTAFDVFNFIVDTPVILVTGAGDEEVAVNAMKAGAYDYLIKDPERNYLKVLPGTVENSIKRKQAEEDRKRLIKEIEAVNLDLTELNQELETIGAERTMSLMALTVADRVRNPSTVIGALSKRILEKEKVSDSLKEKLISIIEEADKLDVIVHDFQTLLKSRKSMFKNDDINRIVQSVFSIVKKEAASRKVEMTSNMSEGPLNINMQTQLLRVALFHTMRNAVEASADGGSINVETFTDKENAVIKVSDTGYGISGEDINRIFNPFFSTKKHGFGMGLPLVKQIISEHLGELRVESEPGSGTTFTMIFPFRWKEDGFIAPAD
ncbi:MAG: hybrid sensor histidine kinase/response regulator [Nitrospirota bacterium]